MLTPRQALMVQGTTSDAGKTLLVAGLGRVLARKGCSVAPFKPQNMALNSAVTADGGEIGRAQAVQAFACNVEPSIDMNPILLKPNSDCAAQVIIQGKAAGNLDAVGFHCFKKEAMAPVMDSFGKLRSRYETILIEGAGSPAEVNLRENDIANMGFAEKADIPVIIVADIDRGGVFAHLTGTLDCLSESERDRVIGFVINKFRGDIALLNPGIDWLEEKTGKPVLGVVPYLHGLMVEAEDAIDTQQLEKEENVLNVAVPVFPRISNHTDFDPLRLHPNVNLQYVAPGQAIPACDLIILPGSKSVRSDLAFLVEQDWDGQIARHLRYGGKVMGICGGYQMLGRSIADPLGIEGDSGRSEGLGYLDVSTELKKEKSLRRRSGTLTLNGITAPVKGYEIHAGATTMSKDAPVLLGIDPDGQVNFDNNVFATYLHGVFEQPEACDLILQWAGLAGEKAPDFDMVRETHINRLADSLENSLDLASLWPEYFS